MWDEFVFARVDWTPKGPRVAGIIEDAQLRPENVLFVDDLPSNLGEAAHYAPGLQTAGPAILDRLLDLPQLVGKDDADLTRLRQYRVLERKLVDRRTADGSHEEFLRSCAIRVAIHEDADGGAGPPARADAAHQPAQLHQAPAHPRGVRRHAGRPGRRGRLRGGLRPLRRLRHLRLLRPPPTHGCVDRLPVLVPGHGHGRRAVALRPPRPTRARGRRRRHLLAHRVGGLDHARRRDDGRRRPARLRPARAGRAGRAGRPHPDRRRVRPLHHRRLPRRGHRHRIRPPRRHRRIHPRRPHRDVPPVGGRAHPRAGGAGRPAPDRRPDHLPVRRGGRPRLRRARPQRPHRLHPGPLPPSLHRADGPVQPLHRRPHRSRPTRPPGPAPHAGVDGRGMVRMVRRGVRARGRTQPRAVPGRTSPGWPG